MLFWLGRGLPSGAKWTVAFLQDASVHRATPGNLAVKAADRAAALRMPDDARRAKAAFHSGDDSAALLARAPQAEQDDPGADR